MKNSTTIQIPEKFYLGLSSYKGSLPRGYMVPWGTTAALKKRMEGVDHWGRDKERVILDNSPVSGFRFSRSQRSLGWRESLDTICIEDPRGFEVDVSPVNMLMLTDKSIIQDGEILQECVWARDGVNTVLVPVNSEPYLDALENMRRISSKIPAKEVALGSLVRLANAEEGIYLGSYHINSMGVDYNNTVDPGVEKFKSSGGKSIILIQKDYQGREIFKVYSSGRISDVIKVAEVPMTEEQCEDMVNKDLKELKFHTSTYRYARVLSLTFSKPEDITFTRVALTKQDMIDAYQEYSNGMSKYPVEAIHNIFLGTGSATYTCDLNMSPYNPSRFIGFRIHAVHGSFYGYPVDKDYLDLGGIQKIGHITEVNTTAQCEYFKVTVSYTAKKTNKTRTFDL